MGAKGSKSVCESNTRDIFTENELQQLHSAFSKLPQGKPSTLSAITEKNIPDDILRRLNRIILHFSQNTNSPKKCENKISWEGFATFFAKLLRGTTEEQSLILLQLSCDSDASSSKEIHMLMSALLRSYFRLLEVNGLENTGWDRVVTSEWVELLCKNLLDELTQNGVNLHCHDIEQWLLRSPLSVRIVQRLFKSILHLSDQEGPRNSSLIPTCTGIDHARVHSILNLPSILFLNQNLPSELHTEWRYLFSSRQFGESFSQFLGKVLNQGPTLLVVKDKNGYIFGGFASVSWQLKPQFAGTNDCFLFSLFPRFAVYNTTGYNDHYMYLNLHQQTMPNGLGMGGQLGYFGLWLDSYYGKGSCTQTCTTYTSSQLSSLAEFEIDTIEAWAVGPLPEKDDEEVEVKKSILDKVDEETKMVLRLADRAPISDVIREEDARGD